MIYYKQYHALFIILIIFSGTLTAQPFIYRDDHYTIYKSPDNTLYRYIKINLNNGQSDTVYQHRKLLLDNTLTWLIDGDNLDFAINNILNKNLKLKINFDPESAVYSKVKNKLYLLGNNKRGNLLTVLNVLSGRQELSINVKTFMEYGVMFLSENEDRLYFPYYDTAFVPIRSNEIKLAYISTLTNKIIRKVNLSELGIPGADSYFLVNGKKGKGIVESRFDTGDRYYTIYDFDHDSGSTAIFYHGDADSYFTNNGKYLILAEKADSIIKSGIISVCTGSILIYNVQGQNMVTALSLPPNGVVLSFDNYPDNLFYIDNKSGKITNLNIESIIASANK